MRGGNRSLSGSSRPSSSTISRCFLSYALADRLLGIAAMRQRRRRRGQLRVPGRNHVRIPTLASGLTLLMFWPGIVKQGSATYSAATGQNSAAVPRPLAVAHRGSVQRQRLWLRGPTCAGSPSCPRRHQPAGPRQRSTGRHPPTAAPLDAAERRRNCPRALPTTGKTKTAPTLCSCRPQTNFGDHAAQWVGTICDLRDVFTSHEGVRTQG